MEKLCRWATIHWVRFEEKRRAEDLEFDPRPQGFASWKFGPDAAPHAPRKSGSEVWCGIASFHDSAHADAALVAPDAHVPGLAAACESWHAKLVPIAHQGECNHLDVGSAGPMFAAADLDPGGPLLVMTTAGFELRTQADFHRLIDFRRRVHRMRDAVAEAGSLAHQVFAPLGARDDGVTMSLWRDSKAMLSFAYGPGLHRAELEYQQKYKTVDRSSFTRFRVVGSSGAWNGSDPLAGVP